MAFHLWLSANLGSPVVVELGDLEFLRTKSLNGDLVFATGNRTTTGVICSYTPATGKTFFLVAGTIHAKQGGTGTNCLVELRNDATVKETLGGETLGGASTQGASVPWKGKTAVQADKLVGNSTKTYDLNLSAVTNLTVYGNLFGWIENT